MKDSVVPKDEAIVSPRAILTSVAIAMIASTGLYAAFVSLLTIPFLQNQVIYLNKIKLTWNQDVDFPEQWGFLHNQVTPFTLASGSEALHAWHILPLGLYRQHEDQLVKGPSGRVLDVTTTLSFGLLRDDPEALLVLYLHGAAGTLGSGYRPPSYRAISAGDPNRVHILAIDYRGFGTSTGSPSEQGLLADAVALADWAMREAGIPAERIVIWGQSIGTAVATSLVHHMAHRVHPVFFSGLVMVAPFTDVKSLTATYRVAGMIPLLGPVARFPRLLEFLNSFIRDQWQSNKKLAAFIQRSGKMSGSSGKYYISIIHAEDDYDIPWTHSDQMFWTAVNASTTTGISFEELEQEKLITKVTLGGGGWSVTRQAEGGVIREDILKYGLHDKIMGYPIISMAVLRAFGSYEKISA